jgi:hypothetical protein
MVRQNAAATMCYNRLTFHFFSLPDKQEPVRVYAIANSDKKIERTTEKNCRPQPSTAALNRFFANCGK